MTLTLFIPLWLIAAYFVAGVITAVAVLAENFVQAPLSRRQLRSARVWSRLSLVAAFVALTWPYAAWVTVADKRKSRKAVERYRAARAREQW